MKNKNIRNICICLLCIILFIYLTICINSYMNNNKIGFFSYRFYIMSSDSSEANINSGDFVVAKSIKIEDIKKDDNIIYQIDDDMIVKKVRDVQNINGNVSLYVQEDLKILNDKDNNSKIIGKVKFKIKGIGNFALFLQNPVGVCSMIITIGCIIIIIKKVNQNLNDDLEDEVVDEKSRQI